MYSLYNMSCLHTDLVSVLFGTAIPTSFYIFLKICFLILVFIRLASLGGGPQAHVHMKGMKYNACSSLHFEEDGNAFCHTNPSRSTV